MDSDEIDETTLSTVEVFEIPTQDEFDRDYLKSLDIDSEEGYMEVPIGVVQDNNSLWDFPPFNDVSVWINHPAIDDHGSHNEQFNTKELRKGGLFLSKESLIYACQRYSIKERREYGVRYSDTKRLLLEYRSGKDKCQWELRASKKNTCEVDIICPDNVHFNKHFIGMDIKDLIREDLRYSPKQVRELMRSNGKNRSQNYRLIWVCLKRPIPPDYGFTHCRPAISIDATYLNGKWKGVLLIAVALDAEDEILPLAYALVESENIDSWRWFMTCIRNGVRQREELCIISDRHAGIMRVMEEDDWKPPKAYHRICIRHFASIFNIKAKCLAKKALLTSIGYENQQIKFCNPFKELKELLKDNQGALMFLDKLNAETWALSYDIGGRRWGP
ncbi:hypothetical protein QQ045_000649 [Rhodiola kirilowii]